VVGIFKPDGTPFEDLDISGFNEDAFNGFEGAIVITNGARLQAVYDGARYTCREAALDFIEELKQLEQVGAHFGDEGYWPGQRYDYILFDVTKDQGADNPSPLAMAVIRMKANDEGKLMPYVAFLDGLGLDEAL
jgi:hypothetical protein